MDKKIWIMIVIILMFFLVSGLSFLTDKKVKDAKKIKNQDNIKIEKYINQEETINENIDNKNTKNIETSIRDLSKPIQGISEEENKEIRNKIINFIKKYYTQMGFEYNSVEEFIDYKMDELDEVLSKELYKNIKNFNIEDAKVKYTTGEHYVFRNVEGLTIYDAFKEDNNINISVSVYNTFYDADKYIESIHDKLPYIVSDIKFTLIKDKEKDKWIINNFNETFKDSWRS